ncbi:MAG: glutaredoxin family protein [Candidatus Nanopelagicaceae bacterium]
MKFTVYSKKGCPYCEKIQRVLEISKLTHDVYFLDEDFTKEEFIDKFGESTSFPQVILKETVGDVYLGGCIETVKYLKEQKIVS